MSSDAANDYSCIFNQLEQLKLALEEKVVNKDYDNDKDNRMDKDAQIEQLKLALERKTNEHLLMEKSLRLVVSMKNKEVDYERDMVKKDLEVEKEKNEKLTETISELQLELMKLRSEKDENDELNSKFEELSRISKMQTNEGTLRMALTNISRTKLNRDMYSDPMFIGGMKWSMVATKTRKDNSHYLSVYLSRDNSCSRTPVCTVMSKIRIIDIDSKANTFERGLYDSFKEGSCIGYDLITWESLLDGYNGYVRDNAIILEIAMTVYPRSHY